MYKATFTIKLGKEIRHINKQYDHSLMLDEAENEAVRLLREVWVLPYFSLDYIGGWEWTIKVDDRVLGHILWTLKG